MNTAARLRTGGILLAVFAIGSMCLTLESAAAGRSCCDETCPVSIQAACCEHAPVLRSASPASAPALIADRVRYAIPRWVAVPEPWSIGRDSITAIGIRTTVLRL